MLITVCIASIGRVSLVETLDSLLRCKLPPDVIFCVVIVDDSLDKKVEQLLTSQLTRWSFSIKIVISGSRNIAIARNVSLLNAVGDYLAFIDDDETADEDWLFNYVDLARSSNADAIFGPVDALYPKESCEWICMAEPFMRRTGKSGDIVVSGGGGNAFVKKSIVDRFKLRFRPDLGQSGGEDTAFFHELYKLGATLIASDNAKVYELVPIDRLTISHLSRRYIRGGQTYASIFFSSRNIRFKIVIYSWVLIKVIGLSFIVPFFYLFRKDIALKYAFRLWLNWGKLRNLFHIQTFNLYGGQQ